MKSEKCNQLAVEIWNWCISYNLYISAEHARGVNNVEADYISRNQNNSGEWSFCQITFEKIKEFFDSILTLDLFTTRINCKVKRFVSWFPDLQSICFGIFCQTFTKEIYYVFTLFNCVVKLKEKS